MKRRNLFGASAILVVAAIFWPCAAQDELVRLLDRLGAGPVDQATLNSLEGRPLDPKTIPALKAAFDRNDRKRDKQLIAVTLIRLGESNTYFDFLAHHAKQAIDDRSPSFLKYDPEGKVVKGQYAAAFENWCAQNGKSPKSMEEFQSDSAMDVLMLAWAQEPRAEELFIRGLNSLHEFVVAYSIEGLGRLQAASAIPKIAEVFGRFPASIAKGLGMQLAWFSDLRAYQLMQRVIPDERLRNSLREGIARQRKMEVERAVRRAGGSAPSQNK
jgi:hypothetical protein